MTYRLRNILIALALAILAALLVTFYVANYKQHVQRQQATVPVVVAARDIPVGTSGADVVKGHYTTTESVARAAVVPGALSSPTQIEKQIVTQPIYAGEQVTARRFGYVVVTGVRSQLTGVYRAVQLPGDPNQLLLGTLQAGDHVDLVASIKYNVSDFQVNALRNAQAGGNGAAGSQGGDQSKVASRIILRDLTVLRTSTGSGSKLNVGGTGGQSWVLLDVTDGQLQKLYWIMANASWSLALRPVLKPADSPSSVETIESVLGDGLRLNQYVQLWVGKAPSR